VHAFCDGVRNGWIGRQLHRRFREQGLIELTVTPHQIFIHREFAQLLLGGFLTAAQKNKLLEPVEVEAWWRDLEAADRADTFLIGFTALIAAGRKPER
jgi:hypothetical protein